MKLMHARRSDGWNSSFVLIVRRISNIQRDSRVLREGMLLVVDCIMVTFPESELNVYVHVRALHKLKAPCKPILTFCKLKTVLPTLKVHV